MCWWVGPQSDQMSAPSSLLGPQSDWCVPYLPLSQKQDSLWSGVAPVWATCTMPGLWCCFNGIWHISWGGSTRCTGVGGAGLASFVLVVPCGRGPAVPGGRPPVGRDVGRVCDFGIRVMLTSENGFGSIHSSSVFWNGLRRIGINP